MQDLVRSEGLHFLGWDLDRRQGSSGSEAIRGTGMRVSLRCEWQIV